MPIDNLNSFDPREFDGTDQSVGHGVGPQYPGVGRSLASRTKELYTKVDEVIDEVNGLPLTATVLAEATELTIDTGVIEVTTNFHTVDTEGDAASDDLDSIDGGEVGQIVFLRPASDARTVVVKHSATLICPMGVDISLAEDDDYVQLLRHSVTAWVVLAWKGSTAGAGGLGLLLASTASGRGASLVGIEDAAGLITAANVEAALLEHQNRLLTNTIADPGNAGAIAVTRSGVCLLTSAGAETRTIAIPSFLGQQIYLVDTAHVGNIVVTASQAINQAGNTIMTFGAVRDTVLLTAISIGGALRWQVTSGEGTVAFS